MVRGEGAEGTTGPSARARIRARNRRSEGFGGRGARGSGDAPARGEDGAEGERDERAGVREGDVLERCHPDDRSDARRAKWGGAASDPGRRARPRTGARRASAIFNERVTSAPSSLFFPVRDLPRAYPSPRSTPARAGSFSAGRRFVERERATERHGEGHGPRRVDREGAIPLPRPPNPPPPAGPAGPAASFEIRAFAPVAPAVADPPPADVPPLPLPLSPTSIRSNSASPWRSPSSRLCART